MKKQNKTKIQCPDEINELSSCEVQYVPISTFGQHCVSSKFSQNLGCNKPLSPKIPSVLYWMHQCKTKKSDILQNNIVLCSK